MHSNLERCNAEGHPDHLGKIRADAPDLAVEIPRPEKEEKPPSLADFREQVANLLSALSIEAPGMVLEVHRGRVALSLGPRPLCALREIEGRIVFRQNSSRSISTARRISGGISP